MQRKSQVLFVYHVLESPRVSASPRPRVPASPRPTSHVRVPLLVTAIKIGMSCNLLLCKVGNIALCKFVYLSQGVFVICLAPVSLLSKRVGLYFFARTKLKLQSYNVTFSSNRYFHIKQQQQQQKQSILNVKNTH